MQAIVRTALAVLFTSVVAFAAPARAAEPDVASAAPAPAAAASAPELGWHSLLEDTVHRVNADGTEVMTYARRHKILKCSALSSMKETTISYSQSAQNEGPVSTAAMMTAWRIAAGPDVEGTAECLGAADARLCRRSMAGVTGNCNARR